MRLVKIISLRLALALPVLFLVSLGTFSLLLLVPGEPARALAGGDQALPEDIERVRNQLGLNDPFVTQFFRWVWNALQFEFGDSLSSQRPVRDTMIERMPATLSIAAFALVVSLLIGMIAGIVAGARPGTITDKVSIVLATIGVSVPSFVLAIVFIQLFALHWNIFPAVRYVPFSESPSQWLQSIALPGFSLGALSAGALSRQLRSGLIDAVNSDYVRTSWAVGSSRTRAIGVHALRNSAIPSAMVVGSQMTFLFGGTVIIEQLFAINGIGTFMYQSVLSTDLPAVQAAVLWFAVIQVVVYLLVDVVLMLLNPKLEIR